MSDSTPQAIEAPAASAVAQPGRRIRFGKPSPGHAFGGITAVAVKELRGRMRGRRAFVILTVYLLLLAGFGWMMELILERQHSGAVAGSAALASAQVGQGIFIAMLMLETLLVIALAPAFTAGAISMEREKQTLDMLATTPVSSLSIVLGKLLSALTYLFILVFASIPLTAMVFVFGGVSPDDVVRGYAVLLATALGLGSVGLFCSALMRRTQAATIATYFGVLAVTIGSFFIFYFWNTVGGAGGTGLGPLKGRPPEALVYLNPYFAQADVMCGVEAGFGDWCSQVAFVSNRSIFPTIVPVDGQTQPVQVIPQPKPFPPVVVPNDSGKGGVVDVAPVQPFGVIRDSLWPKSVVAWLVLSAVLIAASVQLVTPTRRVRLRLPRFLQRKRTVST
ncbi:MAG: ABC transporter permease [Chloroflexota bacterium]|nr:ABC transporter permease [Chloroflexota bacterium]